MALATLGHMAFGLGIFYTPALHCPVVFSGHSRQALRYAAMLVSRNRGRLIAIFVEDPMLVEAVAYDEETLIKKGRAALREFVERDDCAVRIEARGRKNSTSRLDAA